MQLTCKELTDSTINLIKNRNCDELELLKIRDEVSGRVKEHKKFALLGLGIIFILTVYFEAIVAKLCMMISGFNIFYLMSPVLGAILIVGLIWVPVMWFTYGNIRSQFNRALSHGWPERYSVLMVR